MSYRLNQLQRERGDLKLQERFREMIPLQLKIVIETRRMSPIEEHVQAWNYLGMIYRLCGEYDKGERAVRKALEVYVTVRPQSTEMLATYQFHLAINLAAQQRFSEAVSIAESAIRNFSVEHTPEDHFLKAREFDLRQMREALDRSAKDNTTDER